MALKLWISIYMSLITSSLTLLVGVHNSITLSAMVQRTLVSLVFFAIVGYVCGQYIERFLKDRLEEIEAQETKIESVSIEQETGDDLPVSAFEPLNPQNFENITLTQK